MKKLIAIALLLATGAFTARDVHAACNPHGTSASKR
jgi:hypothetical protein